MKKKLKQILSLTLALSLSLSTRALSMQGPGGTDAANGSTSSAYIDKTATKGQLGDLNFASIDGSSTDLSEAGIYVSQDESYTYFYVTASKAATSTAYRTVGFTIHANKENGVDLAGLTHKIEIPIEYTDYGAIKVQPMVFGYLSTGASYYTDNAGESIVFENKGAYSISETEYADDTYGGKIGTCWRVNTATLSAVCYNSGISNSDTNTLYLSGINTYKQNGTWVNKLYRDRPQFQDDLLAAGFKKPTVENDIPKLYDIPIKIKSPQYTLTYLDATTGKPIQEGSFSKISSKEYLQPLEELMSTAQNASTLVENPYTKESVLNAYLKTKDGLFEAGGKYYIFVGVAMHPSVVTKDAYLSQVADKISTGETYPSYLKYGEADPIGNTISKLKFKPYTPAETIDTYGFKTYGSTFKDFDGGVSLSTSIDTATDINFTYANPLYGMNVYFLLQEYQPSTTNQGSILYVNGQTGMYFPNMETTIDYADEITKAMSGYRSDKIYESDGRADDTDIYEKVITKNISYCVQDNLGNSYKLDHLEYVNDFELDPKYNHVKSNDIQTNFEPDSWSDYITKTQVRSVNLANTGTDPYLGKQLDYKYNESASSGDNSMEEFTLASLINIIKYSYYNREHDAKYEYESKLIHPLDTSDADKTAQRMPLYRAIYMPLGKVNIYYYNVANGLMLEKQNAQPADTMYVKTSINKDDVIYNTQYIGLRKEISYDKVSPGKIVNTVYDSIITPEGETSIDIPAEQLTDPEFCLVVSCTTEEVPRKIDPNTPVYTIGSQWLTDHYVYNHELSFKVKGFRDVYHKVSDGKGGYKEYYSPEYRWGSSYAKWQSQLAEILSLPSKYIAAGWGTLTKVSGMEGSSSLTYRSNEEDSHSTPYSVFDSGEMAFQWTSHRTSVDDVQPILASYMNIKNKEAIKYLTENDMSPLAKEGLTPNDKYGDNDGVANSQTFTVAISPDTVPQNFGWKYIRVTRDSDGSRSVDSPEYQMPSQITNINCPITVKAEPTIVAKKLAVAADFTGKEGEFKDEKMSYFNACEESSIEFYPTYKMLYEGGKPVYVLGKEKRTLNPINVADISIEQSQMAEVKSTWSRDQQDTGNLSMKSGYVLDTKSKEPLKMTLTTYTVVPKIGYVEKADEVRTKLLDNHNTMVDSLKINNKYDLFTNLPESWNDSVKDEEWRFKNPYTKGTDNVMKSRIPDLKNSKVTSVNQSSSVMSLSDLDNMYKSIGVDNAKRLKNQLEKNDWYQEEFEGFEVVKQTTTISMTFDSTQFVNFLRNGGDNSNDLAKAIRNIPANKFGITAGYYNEEVPFYSNKIEVERLTKPFLFNVRGTVFDDRI